MRWEAAHAPTPNPRVMARLTLGTMARNLAERAPSRAARIVGEIERQLLAAPSKEEARLGLMALGNAGSARALPTTLRFLRHPSPSLRASAVASLRWIDDPRAFAWLTRGLKSDPAVEVRAAAADALSFREPTGESVAAQQSAFRKEKVESVRLAILANLGRAKDAFPTLREWLRQTAARDRSPNVRKAAAALKG